jgi:hypothetical protein
MRRLAMIAGLLLVASAVATSHAWALEDHHRPGWLVGIGYGGGSGQFTDGQGQSATPERGPTPQIRIGHSLARRWILGVNYEGWFFEQGDVTEKNRYSLQNLAATATFFPGNPLNASGGFFLRGGAGLAWGRYANVPLEYVDGVLTQQHGTATNETGLGFVFGAGYEFRVTRHFAAGLSASANYLTISQDLFDDGLYFPLALNLNWYF